MKTALKVHKCQSNFPSILTKSPKKPTVERVNIDSSFADFVKIGGGAIKIAFKVQKSVLQTLSEISILGMQTQNIQS